MTNFESPRPPTPSSAATDALTFQVANYQNAAFFDLHHLQLQTLKIQSEILKSNPWGDASLRSIPILIPNGEPPKTGFPVIVLLSGFSGTGTQSFNVKPFELSLPQKLDALIGLGEAPEAVYVFCEAMTTWGGSQYLNSAAMGQYEDYFFNEILPAVKNGYRVAIDPHRWCVMGGSSGGYGALHLISRRPGVFGIAVAIAPDSFFDASLLPEVWKILPVFESFGGTEGVLRELKQGRIQRHREFHSLMNFIAMGLCYAPAGEKDFELPVEKTTGLVISEIWEKWKKHDPVVFLSRPERVAALKAANTIYLDVGTRDQFHLQFGTRQIASLLADKQIRHLMHEFDGTHFDIGERRAPAWSWLKKQPGW